MTRPDAKSHKTAVVCLFPAVVKVNRAENSETESRDGVDASGTEKATVAPPRGTLLWAKDGAWWDSRLGSEDDQEVPARREEEEEEEGDPGCLALLYKEARRASQQLQVKFEIRS